MENMQKKRKTLYVNVGIPGSGKSTYSKKTGYKIVSRDEIRFNLLKENEDYFSKETEVYRTFVNEINELINDNVTYNIIADATHLSIRARKKLLDKLFLENVDIVINYFDIPVEVCLSRNHARTGLAKVPESAIRNMYKSLEVPSYFEDYTYKDIKIIDTNGNPVSKLN